MTTGLSIIIPTRNEQENIDHLLERIFQVEFLASLPHEVLFVDDSSSDHTRDRVRHWCLDRPVRLLERDGGYGLASAVVAGAQASRYDLAVVMDADLSHPPEKIPELVAPLLDGDADMVIGSRYVAGGATPEWPLSRRVASKVATLPARLFTDVNDPMAGFFAVSTGRLQQLRPDVPGFKIGLEVLAVGGEAMRVAEVPIVFHDRFEGFSKMNKKIIFAYLKQVVELVGYDTATFSARRLGTLTLIGVVLALAVFFPSLKNGLSPLVSHLLGALAAVPVLLLALARMWLAGGSERRFSSPRLLACLPLAAVAVVFQGGVFGLFLSLDWVGTTGAFALGACAGAIVTVAGASLYVFAGRRVDDPVMVRLVIVGAILSLLLLRLVYLGLPELMEQEAYYWNYAQHLDLSYLDHPAMVAWLIGAGTTVFSTTEFGVRSGAFMCWLATAFFAYRLAVASCSRTAALGSVLLVSMLPLYFGTGLVMTPDAPLHAAWAALLYFLYRALIEGKGAAWPWIGVSLGLGLLSKYTIVLLGPAVLLFMIIDRRARAWFLDPRPYVALLVAVLLFLPVLIWNLEHDWASFLFQGEQRVSGRTMFTTHRLIAYVALQLTPAGLLALGYFFFQGRRGCGVFAGSEPRAESPSPDRGQLLLILLVLAPLAVFTVFSLTREVKLNWTSPAWLAALPILGATAAAAGGAARYGYLRLLRRLWLVTALLLVVGYGVGLHYVTLGWPGLRFPPGPFLIGWRELAVEVEQIVDDVEKTTGARPVVVGMDPYQISSGLAFYRTWVNRDDPERRRRGVEETLGWHLFGWDALMYRYWAEPSDYYGRDILAVGSTVVRVKYPYYQYRFRVMSNIHPIYARKNDTVVRQYFFRLVRGYREQKQRPGG